MSWAFKQNLPAAEKLVLLSLADHFNGTTGLCIPGQKAIAEQTSMSVRTIQRHLKQLERRGLIARKARFRGEGRGRTSDRYTLAMGGDNVSCYSGEATTKATNQDDQHDNGVAPITGREPEGSGERGEWLVRRLVVELAEHHNRTVEPSDSSLGETYLTVARTASQVYDEKAYRGHVIGLTVELLERAFGPLPKNGRGMVARLVATNKPLAVLEAAARTTGAAVGSDPKYADDPLGPVRYLAGILRGGR